MNTKPSDKIYFRIGSLTFPRVRSNFKYECKPVYTNVNTSLTGVTSQTFVRDQIVISGVNFDPCTQEEYAALASAMNIGTNSGGAFNLTFFNFNTGIMDTRSFIVKSLPITVITVTDGVSKVQMDAVTFQEV